MLGFNREMASYYNFHKRADGSLLRADRRQRKTKREAITAAQLACERAGVAFVEVHRWDKPVGNQLALDEWLSGNGRRYDETFDCVVRREA